MTEQDLAEVREALTDEVMSRAANAYRRAYFDGTSTRLKASAMRDAILSALAPLVRPVPTCATCQALRSALERIANDPHCVYYAEGTGDGQYGIGVVDGHRCAADTARAALAPRPSTPEGSAK